MTAWTPDPCTDSASWTRPTICRRPYGRGAYGLGPYGRCAIVGGTVWGLDVPCAPFNSQAPAPLQPWRRAGG